MLQTIAKKSASTGTARYALLDSPVGTITAATDGAHLTALHLPGDRYFAAIPEGWIQESHPILEEVHRQLLDYLAGRRLVFDLPLAPAGTPFQQAVWQALQGIASGATSTYSAIAQQIGRPQAVRAVGTAIGRNPICIVIPCHRVLASSGGFGGYVAGLAFKQRLLALEQAAS